MDTTSSAKDKEVPKINIKYQLMNRVYINRPFILIKEIQDKRILILNIKSFEIFDIRINKRICWIEGEFEEKKIIFGGTVRIDNNFYDFIELKNKDLILWSTGKIFHYKKFDNSYKLSQVINEVTQQKNETQITQIGYMEIYDLYNIIELDNNILLSCNSVGIKYYNFINNEYKLEKVIPMLDVSNVIQINPNNPLIIHHYTYHSRELIPFSYDKFGLSLFDINSNKIINKIFEYKTSEDYSGKSKYEFNYCLIGDNFIYQICYYPHYHSGYYDDDINENEKEELSFNFNIYNIKNGNNIKDLETSFRLISYFKDNLVFAEENKSLNVCYFENNKFYSVYKFDFFYDKSNFCILKNNDVIIWYETYSFIRFYHYEYLNK